MRYHDSELSMTPFTKVFLQQPVENSSQFYDEEYGFTADLRNRVKAYGGSVYKKRLPTHLSYMQ